MIFDLDGTLAHTLPVCIEAYRIAIVEHGGPSLSDQEIRAQFGPSEEGMFEQMLGERWKDAFQTFLVEYERLHDSATEVFDGLIDLLDTLEQRGTRRGLVTGKGPHSAAISLRRLGLEGRFEEIACGSPTGGVKSDCLRDMLATWDLHPDDALYVGDSPYDVQASREVGMRTAAAAWAPSVDKGALQAESPFVLFDDSSVFARWLA